VLNAYDNPVPSLDRNILEGATTIPVVVKFHNRSRAVAMQWVRFP